MVAALVVAAAVLPASPAQAFGNNRDVSRGCGTNYVASGYVGDFRVYAQTYKVSGSCAGRLSAALQFNSGERTTRKYGTNQEAYQEIGTPPSGIRYGLHWGCDNCGVTYS